MKKRWVFYFVYGIVLCIILYISLYIYFRDIEQTTLFFNERKANVILIVIVALFLSNLFDLISFRREARKNPNIRKEVFVVISKTLIIILITSFVELFVFFQTKLGRVVYVNYFFLMSLFLVFEHLLVNYLIKGRKDKILWLSTISVSQVTENYLEKLSQQKVYKPRVNEFKNKYDLTIYDYPPKSNHTVHDILKVIVSSKNPVDLVTYIEENAERIPLRYVDELWLLKNIRTYETVYDKTRRYVNFLTSLLLLIVLFPLAFLVAVIHKLESRGSLFIIQKRIGYEGKGFNLIKFRTMIEEAEKNGPQFTNEDDPRITKIGKIMRVFRIDEVPQLINVLKGDINLIGPRPEREEFIDTLEKEIPFYRLRLEIRPGLTGWAQVNYSYAGYDIDDHLKKLEYDLYYIKNRNISLDFIILLRTIKTMFSRKGT